MNKLTIIGNLTKDPDLRTTASGVDVCTFNVAVNRPKRNGEDQGADYFRVTAWRERADLCANYLQKGRKVCVIGPVSVRVYTDNNGDTRASMEVQADEVEFLSPRGSEAAQRASDGSAEVHETPAGFTAVETDELPF